MGSGKGKARRLQTVSPASAEMSGAPTTITSDGSKEWRREDGKLHRVDGPAKEFGDGSLEWWQDDHLHREDGPAVLHVDGKREWWVRGEKLDEEEVERLVRLNGWEETRVAVMEKVTF